VARNLLTGEGYTWQGLPAVLAPPGWPLFLAGALLISPSFLFLNSVLVALCAGAAALWFWILQRLCSVRRAFAVAGISALLFEWHRAAQSHYTEALFFFLFAAALLLALQIGEGRCTWWRLPLLLLTGVLLVSVRYAGVLAAPLLAAGLLHRKAPDRRRVVLALLVAGVMAGAFFGIRRGSAASARRRMLQIEGADLREEAEALLDTQDELLQVYVARGPVSRLRATALADRWVARLFWPPAALRTVSTSVAVLVGVVGWSLVLLYLFHSAAGALRCEWLWGAVFLYAVPLISASFRPVPRYLAPVAPLLLLGVWQALDGLSSRAPRPGLSNLKKVAVVTFLAAVLLCNGAILAVGAWAVHRPDFAGTYFAGEYGELVAVSRYLRASGAADGDVAACVDYSDPVRTGETTWARRIVVFLTGLWLRPLEAPPPGTPAREGEILEAARETDVRFVLTAAENRPSRIWHVTVSPSGDRDAARSGQGSPSFHILWKLEEHGAVRVPLHGGGAGVWQVPGL
jgi:hypothetical protein